MTAFIAPTVAAIDNPNLAAKLQQKLDDKTKPQGSLGRIETLAFQLGMILGTTTPTIVNPEIYVFAADHGLTKHGISAFPSAVTAQMVQNFLNGGAAINVLARQHHIGLKVVDAGVNASFAPHKNLIDCKVRMGSRDALTEPAMTAAECQTALNQGMTIAENMNGNLLIVGEMGIGNTSLASLLLAKLGNLPIATCIGRGTGLDDKGLAKKQAILTEVLTRYESAKSPFEILAALGGLEIAMMAGALIKAASLRKVLLIDGFIASAALLVAEHLAPNTAQFAIFAHKSAEAGHIEMLKLLNAKPLLEMDLRLGEGSGAALAYPLLVSACVIMNEMASFSEAGVSEKSVPAH